MQDENLDVNNAEETATDESVSEQTTVTDEESDTSDQGTQTEEERIPRSRFNQAIEKERAKYQELQKELDTIKNQQNKSPEDLAREKQFEDVKSQLKGLGFMTKDELEAERNRAKEDDFVRSELSRLEKDYDGKDGKPKFDRQTVIQYALDNKIGDPEAAFLKMNQKAIFDWQIRSAVSKSKGVKTETSDGSGSSQVGTSNEDLKNAAMNGDHESLKTLLKRQFSRS